MYGLRFRLTAEEMAEQEAIAATVKAPPRRNRLRNHILRLYDAGRNVYWDLDTDEPVTVGRTLENDVVIPSSYVSRLHCRIEHGRYIWDGPADGIPSKNGTYLIRQKETILERGIECIKVDKRKILMPGDEISLGNPELDGSYRLKVIGVERKNP